MYIFISTGMITVLFDIAKTIGLIADIEHLLRWSAKSTAYGFILSWISVALVLYISKTFYCRVNEYKVKKDLVLRIDKYIQTIIMTLPLLVLNVSYDRLIRIYYVLVCIIVFSTPLKRHLKKSQLKYYSAFIVLNVYLILITIVPYFKTTLQAILEYNYLNMI